MYQAIIIIHVLLGLGIIGLVLMQQGKGADAGAAFGTGASGSVFGAQGAASFLSRTTAILATLFFSTSLGLAVLNSHRDGPTDIMSEPAAEKESVAVPGVEGAKIETPAPAAVPAPVTQEPAAPIADQATTPKAETPAPAAEEKKEAPKKGADK